MDMDVLDVEAYQTIKPATHRGHQYEKKHGFEV